MKTYSAGRPSGRIQDKDFQIACVDVVALCPSYQGDKLRKSLLSLVCACLTECWYVEAFNPALCRYTRRPQSRQTPRKVGRVVYRKHAKGSSSTKWLCGCTRYSRTSIEFTKTHKGLKVVPLYCRDVRPYGVGL